MSLPAYLQEEGPQGVFAALPGSRAVGGCVRDSLAGLPVRDLDMAAPFPPEEIAHRLKAAGFKVFETGLAHGTVTAVWHGVPIEVTSLRRDVTTDGRHAEVEWTTDWREDAERRDFTINAMSMGADEVLHDYFSGEADLRARRVRFVGDATQRLREDYLRALRFFRSMRAMAGPCRTRPRSRRSARPCPASPASRPSGSGASSSGSWKRRIRARRCGS